MLSTASDKIPIFLHPVIFTTALFFVQKIRLDSRIFLLAVLKVSGGTCKNHPINTHLYSEKILKKVLIL